MPVSDLDVQGPQIRFKILWEKHEVQFRGQLIGTKLQGVFGTELEGAPISGDWSLIKLTPIPASDRIELPPPTGPYAIGRTTFHWTDETRPERESKREGEKRELLIYVWYPAAHAHGRVRYLPDWNQMRELLSPLDRATLGALTVAAQ